MSDTESLEPIGEAERDDVRPPVAADQSRPEIDQARAATERFRSKATELIKELREREARARDEADLAVAGADDARAQAREAIEHAKRVEAEGLARARAARRHSAPSWSCRAAGGARRV